MTLPPQTTDELTEERSLRNGGKPRDPSKCMNDTAPPPKFDEDKKKQEWLGRLRVLRAEAQDLRVVLNSIRKSEATLDRYASYIKMTCDQMSQLVAEIHDEGDDCIRHIHNAWEQMKTCRLMESPDVEQFKAEEMIQNINLLDAQCRQIIYWTGYRTIPERLQRWLEDTRPGYAIPFHAVFEDEMPDAEDRQRILQGLSWAPEAVKGGMVDPDSGLVYRYEERLYKRYLSFLWVLGALVAATALVHVAGRFPLLNGIVSDPTTLYVGWAAVLMGTLVHIGVATAKRMRARSANWAAMPVEKFSIVVNAKLGFILLRVFMALIGFFVLVYASRMSSPMTPDTFMLNAFLVGYSLDNVVELFGASMDQRAAAQLANLKKRLGAK